jgi:hypothetical protein
MVLAETIAVAPSTPLTLTASVAARSATSFGYVETAGFGMDMLSGVGSPAPGTGMVGACGLGCGWAGFLAAPAQPPAIRLTPINRIANVNNTFFDGIKIITSFLLYL